VPFVNRVPRFDITLVSRAGSALDDTNCILIFARQNRFYWAIPPDNLDIRSANMHITKVVPYTQPVRMPPNGEYGLLFGPAVYPKVSFFVLAHGHHPEYFDGSENSNVLYHENRNPKSWEDKYTGASYYLTPLDVREAAAANIAAVRETFLLPKESRLGAHRLRVRRGANLLEEFLKGEASILENQD